MYYNPTFPGATYQNPYQSAYQQMTAQPLQQEQVTQVNGRASVEQIQLAPNSSKLVMDTTAPIVWLCVSDGVGRVTATPYDITEHRDAPPVDVSGLEQRIAAVETAIKQLMEVPNEQPNAPTPAAESAGVTYTAKRNFTQNAK